MKWNMRVNAMNATKKPIFHVLNVCDRLKIILRVMSAENGFWRNTKCIPIENWVHLIARRRNHWCYFDYITQPNLNILSLRNKRSNLVWYFYLISNSMVISSLKVSSRCAIEWSHKNILHWMLLLSLDASLVWDVLW